MSKIVGKIKWIAAQCVAIALVALATNLLESAGALPSHSAAVTHPTLMTIVDRSGKGNRLVPAAGPYNARAFTGVRVSGQFFSEALATQSRRALSHLIREDLQIPSSGGL